MKESECRGCEFLGKKGHCERYHIDISRVPNCVLKPVVVNKKK